MNQIGSFYKMFSLFFLSLAVDYIIICFTRSIAVSFQCDKINYMIKLIKKYNSNWKICNHEIEEIFYDFKLNNRNKTKKDPLK